MNGGVSLAVWMSGVTREIDRLRQHDGVYGELLDLIHATARVDVIAGASAGGLTGTLLGLAVATDSEVSSARDLWIKEGGFSSMLRDPFEPNPPSLLYGDDYFLVKVQEALANIVSGAGSYPTGGGPPGTGRHDVHVIVTATTLTGVAKGFNDLFGRVIRDFDHRQAFHFKRTADEDDFDLADERTLWRLALAGRTTSSFPGAFEPSFIPVEADADERHPAMKPVAEFGGDRWAIDGGVLVNTPFKRALDEIRKLPAERPVRRVLVYIVASAGTSLQTEAVKRDSMPGLQNVVLDALSNLPRVQSFAAELEEIERSNRRVAERKDARRQLLLSLDDGKLADVAQKMFPAYLGARAKSAIADVHATVVDRLATAVPAEAPAPGLDPEAVANALPRDKQPWVPSSLVVRADMDWDWGLAPVEYGANILLDVLREGLKIAEVRPTFRDLRRRTHEQLALLREHQAGSAAFWAEHAEAVAQGTVKPEDLLDEWKSAHAEGARDIAFELGRIAADAADALAAVSDSSAAPDAIKLARALVPPDAADRTAAAVRSMLALHVVQRASGSELADVEQHVDLVQLSANVANAFDGRDRADKKLAGLQLHHFGAFYKQSWRANDWLWGRLDGATRLVQIVLSPARLHDRIKEGELSGSADVADRLLDLATSAATTDEERAYLAGIVTREQLIKELADLDGPDAPTTIPNSWKLVSTAIQLGILREELRTVADAAAADVGFDCWEDAAGATWAKAYPPDPLTPVQVVDQFKGCKIGEETIENEVFTDYFTRLTSHVGAVAGTVLQGTGSGLPSPARRIAKYVRGILLALYLLASGVTSKHRVPNFLVALALGVGGALLALTLVASPPAIFPTIGATILLAGVGLALLRGGHFFLLIWTVAAIAVIVVGIVLVERFDWLEGRSDWVADLARFVPIVFLAFLVMLLGWMKWPKWLGWPKKADG
jgi:patatin-related protein